MTTEEQLTIALEALHEIVAACGEVCDDFLECTHSVCASSAGAWLTACTALDKMTTHQEGRDCASATAKHQL